MSCALYLCTVLNSNILNPFQVIGCLGAIRLNERLLNAYWLLLLALLMGDAMVGGAWLFKYQRIAKGLEQHLQGQFQDGYPDKNGEFRTFWDGIQAEDR